MAPQGKVGLIEGTTHRTNTSSWCAVGRKKGMHGLPPNSYRLIWGRIFPAGGQMDGQWCWERWEIGDAAIANRPSLQPDKPAGSGFAAITNVWRLLLPTPEPDGLRRWDSKHWRLAPMRWKSPISCRSPMFGGGSIAASTIFGGCTDRWPIICCWCTMQGTSLWTLRLERLRVCWFEIPNCTRCLLAGRKVTRLESRIKD